MLFRGSRRGRQAVDARAVTRAIGRSIWPELRAVGFEAFTGRNAWRYTGDAIDLVNFQSFGGQSADSVGCTSFSFAVNLGVWRPSDAWGCPQRRDAEGRFRPQDYECEPHRLRLHKTLSQPWFRPLRSDVSHWPESMKLHREGLKRVLRTDTHDRPEIWFVLADGSNLDECLADALEAIRERGLPWFESVRA